MSPDGRFLGSISQMPTVVQQGAGAPSSVALDVLASNSQLDPGRHVVGPVALEAGSVSADLASRLAFLLEPKSALVLESVGFAVHDGWEVVYEAGSGQGSVNGQTLAPIRSEGGAYIFLLSAAAQEKAAPFLKAGNSISFSLLLGKPGADFFELAEGALVAFQHWPPE